MTVGDTVLLNEFVYDTDTDAVVLEDTVFVVETDGHDEPENVVVMLLVTEPVREGDAVVEPDVVTVGQCETE